MTPGEWRGARAGFEVVPVIDLKGGLVVHARAGDRANYRPIETPLSRTAEPPDVVAGLLGLAPFQMLYIADLDAIAGAPPNSESLRRIARRWPGLDIWLDAGASSARDLTDLPDSVRPVIGSESQRDDGFLRSLGAGGRHVLSLDFRGDAFQGPPSLLSDASFWPGRIVAMTLARVGTGAGPDTARLAAVIAAAGNRAVFAAGGVRGLDDLQALQAIGCAGALVATALHDGRLAGADILARSRPE